MTQKAGGNESGSTGAGKEGRNDERPWQVGNPAACGLDSLNSRSPAEAAVGPRADNVAVDKLAVHKALQ